MTADLFHQGHINILKNMKSLCQTLVVGLSTDKRASLNKRNTWFSYEHRKATLLACKYVDAVVEDIGATKQESYQRIPFDVLFIGDDYIGTEEYVSFQKSHPHVTVYFLPRTNTVSTSDLITLFEDRVKDGLTVLAYGINGPLFRWKLDKRDIVIKNILVGIRESCVFKGEDVYNISVPPPRNWKGESESLFPMIGGVNSMREILIFDELSHLPWTPFIESKLVYSSDSLESPVDNTQKSMAIRIEHMLHERKFPSKIYSLYMKHCGQTLKSLILKTVEDHGTDWAKTLLDSILEQVCIQIEDMREIGVVHGDLHPENVCVALDGTVRFVDFGWCMSSKFKMDRKETIYYETCLKENFDKKHFVKSLEAFKF